MRKFAWLTVLAVIALAGASGNAFAHQHHHHAAPVAAQPVAAAHVEQDGEVLIKRDSSQSVRAAGIVQPVTCPHGEASHCDVCCGCAGSVAAAVATPERVDPVLHISVLSETGPVAFSLRDTADVPTGPPRNSV
jgi:hypothetical protein